MSPRIGEEHHNATLSDDDVDMIRELHEEHGLSYNQLADKFDVPKSTIKSICKYDTRAKRADK